MTRAAPLVAMGAISGAAGRWGVFELLDQPTAALLIVNTIGSALFGFVVVQWPRSEEAERLALGVGFCGGLTTFSTFAVDIAVRLDGSDTRGAVGVALASVTLAIAAYIVSRAAATHRRAAP